MLRPIKLRLGSRLCSGLRRGVVTQHPIDPKWSEVAKKELKGKDPEKLVWHTAEGIAIKPIYTAQDVVGLEPELPGQFPYTRGPHPTMYAQRPWTIRQANICSCCFIQNLTLIDFIFPIKTSIGKSKKYLFFYSSTLKLKEAT